MKTYQISYENNQGKAVLVKARGEDCEDAFRRYAARPVFGGSTIFCNIHTWMYDAETRGQRWGIFFADGIRVEVDACE